MSIGIVIIGRNEGERLRRCLLSVVESDRRVVYVDSGSCDGSCVLAHSMHVDVVELSTNAPYTAARARNTGFKQLMEVDPRIEFVQYVDGDCEVDLNWIDTAALALGARPDVAVVCGRRRERFPRASIYNLLCDMEWDSRPGEATECGGDAMFRVQPLRDSGGYKEDLIAGEEPELCVRLRNAGWKILRLDAEMTLHDAAMTRFGQWWRRNVRAGFAYAGGAHLHGNSPVQHWVKQTRSNWVWGAIFPLAAVLLAWSTRGLSVALLACLMLLLVAKIFQHELRRGRSHYEARLYAFFCAVGKFPQAYGQLMHASRRVLRRQSTLIEYKTHASLNEVSPSC